MAFDRPQRFQQGDQWLAVHNGLKGSPLENGAMANGHYSDSLSRKLDRILNDNEYSDVEEAENISVQGNLEMQVSKLLDDSEDEVSSNAWSEGSSSSSVEHFSARDFVGLGMFEGASNSNLELSSNPVQPLGVELAAALDSPSQHSSDSEETVGEEDGSVLCVYNTAVDLKNGWVGSDNESSTDKSIEGKGGRQKRPSSVMYPSSSASDSDDEIIITNPQAPKQYSVHMSSEGSSNNTLQSNEPENSHSNSPPNLPTEELPPTPQDTTKDASPVDDSYLCDSAVISVETKPPTEQIQVQQPLLNGSPLSESPISGELFEQETPTNTLPAAKPSTSSRKVSIGEEAEVKSGTSVDSQENELELIKLQVCPINIILIALIVIPPL